MGKFGYNAPRLFIYLLIFIYSFFNVDNYRTNTVYNKPCLGATITFSSLIVFEISEKEFDG